MNLFFIIFVFKIFINGATEDVQSKDETGAIDRNSREGLNREVDSKIDNVLDIIMLNIKSELNRFYKDRLFEGSEDESVVSSDFLSFFTEVLDDSKKDMLRYVQSLFKYKLKKVDGDKGVNDIREEMEEEFERIKSELLEKKTKMQRKHYGSEGKTQK